MRISEYLHKGAKNALTSQRLQELLRCSRDEVRSMVRSERLAGIPICSRTTPDGNGAAGYFLPETVEECAATIAQIRSREKELKRTRKALEKALALEVADDMP